MKRFFFFLFFVNSILSIYAQSASFYNYQGDQALQQKDYQAARSWYSIGLDSCDRYSIRKLVEVWNAQPSMHKSMQLPMLNCFNCMKTIVKYEEPDMMLLFSDFYKFGIGTPQDSTLYNYWYGEWAKSMRNKIDIVPLQNDSSENTIPRKGLLSNRFYLFLTYTYSPTMPYGITAGIYFDKIGVYVSGKTDFKSVNAAYDCNNTNVPAIDIENPLYEFNRESWCSRMITGGLLYPIVANRLFVSVGGGYGRREYYREIITTGTFPTGKKSEWCFNTEASYEGLTLEAGGMYIWKKFVLAGGINSTRFKDLDIYLSVGLAF